MILDVDLQLSAVRLQRLRQPDLHPRIVDQVVGFHRLLALLDLHRIEDKPIGRRLLRRGIRIRCALHLSAVADAAIQQR